MSGSCCWCTFKNKPLLNAIVHGTHHPVDVHDIFDFTRHMQVGNTNNSKFIRDFMKGVVDELDPRKELFDPIKFYGKKVVQVAGQILEVDHQNLTCML